MLCVHACLAHVDVYTCVGVSKQERQWVKRLCVCGEQGRGQRRPRPPSLNWKRRLLTQRRNCDQVSFSEAEGTRMK